MLRATCVVVLLAQASDWRTTQELAVARAGPVAVALPIETLDAAQPNLEDLRLQDPSGVEVPWTMERPPRPIPAPRPAAGLQTFLREGSTEVVIRTGMDEPIARLDLDVASSEFVKAAKIEESENGRMWTLIREDEPVFVTGGARKTSLELPPGRRAHLRVTLNDRRSPPVPVTGVRIVAAAPPPAPAEPVEIVVAERREEPGRTRFILRFPGRHARLADVSIDTPEAVFARRAELLAGGRGIAEGTLHRTSIDGRPPVEARSLPVDVRLPSREAELVLHNGNSPPLRVDAIRARVRPVRIHFVAATTGTYRLLAGNPAAPAPRYDVAALGEPGAGPAALVPGPIRVNPSWRPPEPLPGVLPAGAPIDVDAWRFRKEVRLGPGFVHELELDPDVLSEAASTGDDLRLVRDGVQVPYLRDDPPRLRPLAVEAARTGSKWTLTFPRSRLPVRRITCRTGDPLFRRQVRLVEEIRDELGATHRRVVAQAVWSRTPDRPPERLELELDGLRRSDRLTLEIDDGDNPPLTLGDFDAVYAAPRLVFKSTPTPGLSLHYGNPRVSAPRYDLDLAASEMISAVKSTATFGDQQPLSPSARPAEASEKIGSIVLWAVLATLTVALVLVIIKVLPAPPNQV